MTGFLYQNKGGPSIHFHGTASRSAVSPRELERCVERPDGFLGPRQEPDGFWPSRCVFCVFSPSTSNFIKGITT